MYCDRRIGGLERWYLDRPADADMLIPDSIRKCIVYIGAQKADGTHTLRGTGFFVSTSIQNGAESSGFMYLVTARHVIEGIKRIGCNKVHFRVNIRGDGVKWVETNITNWRFHPDDPSVDVAAAHIVNLDERADHARYPAEAIGSINTLMLNGVGLGDEVFVTGLFSHHTGTSRNVPIVRAGNIAAMPEEKVRSDEFGLMDAYLIEMRSIGGISGSPVFAYLGPVRTRGPRRDPDDGQDARFFLFGLIHGHFDTDSSNTDDIVEDAKGRPTNVNVGIAIVVPGEKILEVINQPKFKNTRQAVASALRDLPSPTMDSLDQPEKPEESFTKQDFEAALKKVSRKLEPDK